MAKNMKKNMKKIIDEKKLVDVLGRLDGFFSTEDLTNLEVRIVVEEFQKFLGFSEKVHNEKLCSSASSSNPCRKMIT